jgi:serum/glucocorticoid-regulated kinase 2
VDWWSIGTLLFEMMTGLPPFYNEDTQEMYRRILFQPLHCPPSMSPEAADVVTALLHRDPAKRLGHHGVKDVQEHPFFDAIDWKQLEEKRLPAPWKPIVMSKMDTSNFDEDFTSQVPKDTPVRASRLTRSVQKKFAGFTFVDESEMDNK